MSGSAKACSSTCAASSVACSSASTPRSARCSSLVGGFVLARGPLGGLFLQLHQALLDALAAFDHEADLGFQPADLGAGFVELALGLVDLVAGGVVRLAHRLQFALDVAQVGDARFQRVDGLVGVLP
jgi:hypothetical protein